MMYSFTITAACCLPVYNPVQRRRESEIMAQPALNYLAASSNATFSDSRTAAPAKEKTTAAARARRLRNGKLAAGFMP